MWVILRLPRGLWTSWHTQGLWIKWWTEIHKRGVSYKQIGFTATSSQAYYAPHASRCLMISSLNIFQIRWWAHLSCLQIYWLNIKFNRILLGFKSDLSASGLRICLIYTVKKRPNDYTNGQLTHWPLGDLNEILGKKFPSNFSDWWLWYLM